jgi:hypothetical protein
MNVWLSEDRATGLVLRYSGEEAREAWAVLCNNKEVPVINALPLAPDNGQGQG